MAVYFIQDSGGAVKIGFARDVGRRLANLQTAHAQELTLIRAIDGGHVEEWECHHRFNDLRIRGEWFGFSEEMLTYVPSGNPKLAILRQKRSMPSLDSEHLAAFVRAAIVSSPLKQKEIAAMMNMSSSALSRKCAQHLNDSHRFTLDDFEKYMEVTGDVSPVLYLVEKYLTGRDRIAALEAELERLKKTRSVK